MNTVTKIEKRNGGVVDFNATKIWKAISKAFLDVRKNFTPEEAENVDEVTFAVVEELNTVFGSLNAVPNVEDVQDLVEKKLMQKGYYDIAKGYIIYRVEHMQKRLDKELEEGSQSHLTVIKKDGTKQAFNEHKIRESLRKAGKDLMENIDVELIVASLQAGIYDGMTTKDIAKAVLMTVRSFIEKDPAYSYLASRLLKINVYREVFGEEFSYARLNTLYQEKFGAILKEAVDAKMLDKTLADFDLEALSKALVASRDDLFEYLGMQTLYDRYFLRNPYTKRLYETPQYFWMRVAMGLALAEKAEIRTTKAIEFYEVMSTLRFVPSTPTLFHAGTRHPQLSSCYLTTVEDDLHHIFKCIGDNAQLSKWSGGIGNDWTNLRGTGALIKGTGVESQGVVPFLKIANDTTASINRSGKRRGATVAYLETWHYDIEDFLELRKNTGDERRRTHDMDTANWIPDLFMKRVKEDLDWTLFSPDETSDLHHIYGKEFEERYEYYEQMVEEGKIRLFKKMKAKDLWKKMVNMLFETGHPWMTFKDPCNLRSPQDHQGVVHSSNLCTEITLNTSADETAVCNLGSLNLTKFVTADGRFDKDLVREVVPVAIRMLDNVIDINFYPTKEAENSNRKHRPIGLGIMGFQDALYLLNIDFASEEMVEFADESMEEIAYNAILASSLLAKEKGVYQSFEGSKWDRGILPQDTIEILERNRGLNTHIPRTSCLDWSKVRESIQEYGMRNSNCMAIAPTATISNVAGSVPGIEPIYKNLYVKSNQGGEFIVINEYLVEDLKQIGLWTADMQEKLKFHDGDISRISEIPKDIRNKYKEVFDIDSKWLIKAAAYRGKWIDQSQSLNIFYKGTSGKDISDIYFYAWEMGLKTTYYLRSLAISQVEKSTLDIASHGVTHKRDNSIGGVDESLEPKVDRENKLSKIGELKSVGAASFQRGQVSQVVATFDDNICESCQ
jgi:ribonucleoside-diphosphate reductase alpha chain